MVKCKDKPTIIDRIVVADLLDCLEHDADLKNVQIVQQEGASYSIESKIYSERVRIARLSRAESGDYLFKFALDPERYFSKKPAYASVLEPVFGRIRQTVEYYAGIKR